VLNLWQGLGYYSRAMNLHSTAKHVSRHLKGRFPGDYHELLKLKGIGPYTAAAIASICFGQPFAVVDGNVSRVISRLYGVSEAINSSTGNKKISQLAQGMLDKKDPGSHNQAMMEFGALQCVPVSPRCDEAGDLSRQGPCPLKFHCVAWKNEKVDQLPKKISKPSPKDRWICFYIYMCKGETAVFKRGHENIWKSLYQFPALESDLPLNDQVILDKIKEDIPEGSGTVEHWSAPILHQLTHRTIHARFLHVRLKSWPTELPAGWLRISMGQIDDFPVPRLINRYMEVAKF
jgi:A/G-specific adenine glycosylase